MPFRVYEGLCPDKIKVTDAELAAVQIECDLFLPGTMAIIAGLILSHRLGPRHLLEEVKELLVAMQLVAGLGLPSGGRFQGSKEGGFAVAHVVV